jgi:hypothetical protein
MKLFIVYVVYALASDGHTYTTRRSADHVKRRRVQVKIKMQEVQ